MQRIEILSVEIHSKSGTSPKTGKPYLIREQEAVLHDTTRKYPQPCRVTLQDDQKEPYAVGVYEIGSPFVIGRYDALQVNRGLGLQLMKKAA